MRSTKIVCTLGPACAEQSILEEMLHAGMNVARMNFSHGDHAMHRKNLETFRRARENVGVAAAVLLDTRGPEIRTLPGLGDKGVEVHVGEEIVFAPENDPTRPEVIGVTYPRLSRHVQPGDRVKAGDLVAEADLDALKAKGINLITPVLLCGGMEEKTVNLHLGPVEGGTSELMTVLDDCPAPAAGKPESTEKPKGTGKPKSAGKPEGTEKPAGKKRKFPSKKDVILLI